MVSQSAISRTSSSATAYAGAGRHIHRLRHRQRPTGTLKKSPDIISRGFVYLRESQDLLHEARILIKNTYEKSTHGMNPINVDYIKENITDEVSASLLQKTAKRPMVIPVILTV